MSQKLPVGGFKSTENAPQFTKDFIENNNKNSGIEYFLEVDIQYLKKCLLSDFPFLSQRIKIKIDEKLILWHATNHTLKDVYLLNYKTIKNELFVLYILFY